MRLFRAGKLVGLSIEHSVSHLEFLQSERYGIPSASSTCRDRFPSIEIAMTWSIVLI